MTTARLGTQGWTSSPKLPKWGSPRDLPCRNCNRNQSYHQDNTNKPRNTINGQTQPKRKKRLEENPNLPAGTDQTDKSEFPPSQRPGLHQLPQPRREGGVPGPPARGLLQRAPGERGQAGQLASRRRGARPQQATVISWAKPSSWRIKVSLEKTEVKLSRAICSSRR